MSEDKKEKKPSILEPHVTEKVTAGQSQPAPVYTFAVASSVNKVEVRRAIMAEYKVKPLKIRMVNLPRKQFVYRGHPAWKPGLRKALVYLKPGEKINLV
ncbi:MAG: 50S ribosomal protein L23 [Patescibacteria group bacterium]